MNCLSLSHRIRVFSRALRNLAFARSWAFGKSRVVSVVSQALVASIRFGSESPIFVSVFSTGGATDFGSASMTSGSMVNSSKGSRVFGGSTFVSRTGFSEKSLVGDSTESLDSVEFRSFSAVSMFGSSVSRFLAVSFSFVISLQVMIILVFFGSTSMALVCHFFAPVPLLLLGRHMLQSLLS